MFAAGAIVLAVILAYANSWTVPFVFDDQAAILHNPSIRDLGHLGDVFSPPGSGLTVDGRPVLNLSLAVNYAMSGTQGWSYHALNILIHAGAALALFGIVRRTLARLRPRPVGPDPNAASDTAIAFAIALLWAVHPLQTESVTYVIQRAESLMGLCYLLTLYAFIRGVDVATARATFGWFGLSWLACLVGMGTKEVMVSAPFIVLLYDRTFVAGSVREALSRRWRYYGLLTATIGVLLVLVLKTGSRGGTSGFGVGVEPWTYWQTQFQAVAHYLWLTFWPGTLVFDYGIQWTHGPAEVLPYALLVGALAALVAVALWRRRAAGFLGVFFFAILAPTSIIPGNRQTLAEHRMYLPLAAVIALVVGGVYTLLPATARRAGGKILLLAALALAALTVSRNRIYQDEVTLYRDNVLKRPGNASAHTNLGNRLRDLRRFDEAIAQYEAALKLRPDYYQAHYDLAIALSDSGRVREAIPHYEDALRLKPDYVEAQNNLGIALARTGRDAEATRYLAEAVRLNPDYVEAHYNLGLALARSGRMPEAAAQFQETVRRAPDYAAAHEALGYAWQVMGRMREAAEQLETAARLKRAAK